MIQIDLEIPKCCDECKFVYDSCKCIITGSRLDWYKSDSERLLDCPLNKIAEPKTGHWIRGKYKDTCNHCRCTYPKNIGFKNYCPNCGMKMRAESEG